MTPVNTIVRSARFEHSSALLPRHSIRAKEAVIVRKAKAPTERTPATTPAAPRIHNKKSMNQTTQYKHKDILESFSEKFPVFEKAYNLYHSFAGIGMDAEDTLKKSSEITLLEVIELIVLASRQAKDAKRTTLRQALIKLDTLKVFMDLAVKLQGASPDESSKLSQDLQVLSKMIGGWARNLAQKEPVAA